MALHGNYKNNKIEGECKLYYDNGYLEQIHNYKNNKIEGEDKLYQKNGDLLIKIIYKDYEIEDYESYSENC